MQRAAGPRRASIYVRRRAMLPSTDPDLNTRVKPPSRLDGRDKQGMDKAYDKDHQEYLNRQGHFFGHQAAASQRIPCPPRLPSPATLPSLSASSLNFFPVGDAIVLASYMQFRRAFLVQPHSPSTRDSFPLLAFVSSFGAICQDQRGNAWQRRLNDQEKRHELDIIETSPDHQAATFRQDAMWIPYVFYFKQECAGER